MCSVAFLCDCRQRGSDFHGRKIICHVEWIPQILAEWPFLCFIACKYKMSHQEMFIVCIFYTVHWSIYIIRNIIKIKLRMNSFYYFLSLCILHSPEDYSAAYKLLELDSSGVQKKLRRVFVCFAKKIEKKRSFLFFTSSAFCINLN